MLVVNTLRLGDVMNLKVKKMTQSYAIEALCWKYEKPYEVYNQVLTGSAILELLTYRYFAIVNEDQNLVGYFCIGKPAQIPTEDKQSLYAENCIDIGLGMKPELTGKGLGATFLSVILSFIQGNFQKKHLRLTVAAFNKRAIHLYKKFGFVKVETFEDGNIEYIIMKKNNDMKI